MTSIINDEFQLRKSDHPDTGIISNSHAFICIYLPVPTCTYTYLLIFMQHNSPLIPLAPQTNSPGDDQR